MIFGRAGSGKTTYIQNKLRDLHFENRGGIILLVPEQFSFESERAVLNLLSPPAAAEIEILSFTRMINRFILQKPALPHINETGKAALMGLCLKKIKDELVLYRRHADTPEFAKKMLDAVSEFKQHKITPESLSEIRAKSEGLLSDKTHELSMIFSAYEGLLNTSFYDPLDDLSRLCEALEASGEIKNKTFLIDSFTGFTPDQMQVISLIIRHAKDVYITLCSDPSRNVNDEKENDFSIFDSVKLCANKILHIARENSIPVANFIKLDGSKRYNSPAIAHLEKNLFEAVPEAYSAPVDNIEICEANNIYDECEYTAAKIKELLRNGMRCRDIAVIARDANDYSGIVAPALQKMDISTFMDARVPAISLPLVRFCLSALDASLSNFSPDAVFALLKTYLTPLEINEISLLENYIILWKIRGAAFLEDFKNNPDGFTEQKTDEQAKALVSINNSRKIIVDLLADLKKNINGSVTDICKAIFSLISNKNITELLSKMANNLEADGDNVRADLIRRSYDVVINTLDGMAAAFKDMELTAKEFSELFKLSFELTDMGSLPQGLDEVSVGSAPRMRPASPKAVFILGVNENKFPKSFIDTGLFTAVERDEINKMGFPFPDYSMKMAKDEEFLLYTAIFAASEKIFISYNKSSVKGETLRPSIAITAIKDVFPNIKIKNTNDDFLLKIGGAKSAISVLSDIYNENTTERQTLHDFLTDSDNEILRTIENDDEVKYNITPAVALDLFHKDIGVSASRVESFYKCKFQYLLKFGIKARPPATAEVDFQQRGSLIHYCLYKLLSENGANGLHNITENDVRQKVFEYMLLFYESIEQMPNRLIYFLERITILVKDLCENLAEEFTESLFIPKDFEIPVGMGEGENSIEPIKLTLPNGGSISVHGYIDRVDAYTENGKTYIRVVDYKSKSKTLDLDEVMAGQNLQMLLYLFSIWRNGDKRYEGDIIPAGVIYMPAAKAAADSASLTKDEYKKTIKKSLKRDGLILEDADIIRAMEKNAEGYYIPAKLNKNGAISGTSKTASLEKMKYINEHIEKLLEQMGISIHSGKFAPLPTAKTEAKIACKYCDYTTICPNKTGDFKKIDKFEFEE